MTLSARLCFLPFWTFLLFPLLAWQPAHARVVATVDGTPIFQRQVDLAMRQQIDPSRLARLTPEQRQAILEQTEKAVLNELVGRILLVHAALREKLDVSEEEVRARMEAIAKRLSGDQTVEAFLAQNGIEKDEFVKDVKESLLIERLIDTKTKELPAPTGEETERYYRENPSEFQQAENVRIRAISLSTRGLTDPLKIDAKRRRLEEIRQRFVNQPDLDFARVAAEESEAMSAQQGGIIGPFGRGQRVVEPELEEAAFAQSPGIIGPVIETRTGFHLVRVEEKNPPRMLRFEEVKGPIVTYLRQMKRREVMLHLVEQWRAVAKIERVNEGPEAATPETPAGQPSPPPNP